MRIRTKLMIAVAVNIIVFVGVIFFGVRPYFIEKSMEQDRQTVESQIASVSETLANRKSTLERTLIDWAVWNDTYTFVQRRNAAYIQSNISEQSLENLSVNAIVYLDSEGEAFYSAFRSTDMSLSKADQQAIIKAVTSRLSNQQDTQNGVYASDFGPTLYVSHPILRSDGSGPSQGTLVMLEFVDAAFVADMSAQTKIPLRIQPARQNQTVIMDGDAGTDVVIPLGTVFQQSDFEVTFTVEQTHYQNTVAMLRLGMIALVVLGLGLFFSLLWTIHRVVIRRLMEIVSELKVITLERDSRLRLSRDANSHDDIEQMATSINEVLAALEDTRAEVIDRAFRDALTLLPNRLALEDYFSNVRGKQDQIGVLGLDLDDFRRINDQYGHRTGDAVLIYIASRLSFYKENGFVARIGADEFMLVHPGWTFDQLRPVARRLTKDLKDWADVNGVKGMAVTIGIDVFTCAEPHHTYEIMMGRLDVVIHEAKLSGKNRVLTFQEIEDGSHYLQTLEMERDLRHALEHDEFELYYQPIVSPRPFAVRGVEALVRWNHPIKGQISPGLFIPVAEQLGLISDLGRWVLEQAVREMKDQVTHHHLFLSINVSKRQIADGSFLASLERVLTSSGFDPHCLHVEITESEVGGNLYELQQFIQSLKAIGVKISLDDFGVGTSSLSFLQSLQLDLIKIDQNFVKGIPENTFDRALLEGLYQTFQTLGIDIVTEGVERPEQLAFVLEHSSSLIQGYHYSKPVPLAQLEHYLKKTVTMYDW
ncbi:EAL domain-containing protein [Exiguobacterium sp. AM39-5BH]|uniref:bifunctional diguanylate cyclase/phosphodiesterase n=1 Tax=Exiguobacterium sp. AM39-5BH TaxID=2292355 RepID=UPI001F3B3119|nr:EAL domain-containing protein [Exiguobacterium sp. AM39-5BH]